MAQVAENQDIESSARGDAAVRERKPRPAPLPDAITYNIPDAGRVSGIGRTTLFGLIKAGRLKVNRETGRTLIVGDSLRELLTGGNA